MPHHDICTKSVALYLKACDQLSNSEIQQITGIPTRTVHNILDRAIERGYDTKLPGRILFEYVADAPKSGRPRAMKPPVTTK
ncbi:hypothetical protein F5Y18DRAFT_413027 [Xylariaceae sp. FL1019]|nr:hypothetical protein F5Y18DRAFT_413027 [Xylariaceae sp. FL1019]